MDKMTVYHGSNVKVEKPPILQSKNTKDFGIGFYCTVMKEQASRWAKRYAVPMVNIYDVRMNTALKILEFKYPTHQINFCSQQALECLEYRGCEGAV